MEKTKKTNNIKSIISIYYGILNSAWVYLNPPYIELTSFDNSDFENWHNALIDYFPDTVITNKNNYKVLKRIFPDCPIIQVKTRDVKTFFSKSCLIEKRDCQNYVDYYNRIESSYKPLYKTCDKALKQCIFTMALYDWEWILKTKLWGEKE